MRVYGCPASSSSWKRNLSVSASTSSRAVERRLWEDLFVNPSEWWDNRLEKRSPRHPDFRHKAIREPLWLSSQHKPSWVDSRLPHLYHPRHDDALSAQLQSFCEQGELDRALDVLLGMDHAPGNGPSHTMYWSVVKACNKKRSLSHAKQMYDHIASLGFESFSLLGEYLVSTLGNCGGFDDAIGAFRMLPHRSAFSWTAVISMYVDCGEPEEGLKMYQFMRDEGVQPNERTFVTLLKACGSIFDLEKGKEIHEDAQRAGLVSNAFVGCTLVSMYGKCGSIVEAENAFDGLSMHNVVSWTAMLSAYVEQGEEGTALQFYKLMQEEGVSPNDRTIVIVLQACGQLAEKEGAVSVEGQLTKAHLLEIGQALHADARRKGFSSDVFVASTLVSMYGKCGSIVEAENVFSGLSQRNIVSWNAMLSAYVECGLEKKALQLYIHLREEDVTLNKRTCAIAIQACCMLAEKEEALVVNQQSIKAMSLEIVQALHVDTRSKGFDSDVFVGNALVSVYGKSGNIVEAENVFAGLHYCDVVSWTGMLSAYIEQGETNKALQLYRHMQEEGVTLDDITLVCALQACSDLRSVDICQQIHFTIFSTRYSLSTALAINLIHAYGSCASIGDAQAVFDALSQHDVVLCTALMDGYMQEGNYGASLNTFEEMKLARTKPDGITFLLVLSACGHTGLVDKGVEYFESMSRDYGVFPEIKHYVSMVDLLGRVGDFSRAEGLLSRMSIEPNLALWLCLLDACRTYGNVQLGKWAFDHAVHLNPEEAAAYALMSNIYANAGMWDYVNHVNSLRHSAGFVEECWEEVG